MGKTEDSGEPI